MTRGTRVLEPLQWALPPRPARREVVVRAPRRPTRRPPLLFVHGANHGAWCWEQWMQAAGERGWHAVAVSLRGHAGSEGHERLRRTMIRDYAHDVLQTIVDLPAPPVLIGHSLGGIVVRRVLATYPAKAAVLVSPAGARNGLGICWRVLRRHPATIGRIVTGQPFRLHADDLFTDPASPEARAAVPRLGLESPVVGLELTWAPRRSVARCPVLVLGGSDDPLVPPVEFVRTARIYGRPTHLFKGMGHELMLERRWSEPLDVMLAWLDREVGTEGA